MNSDGPVLVASVPDAVDPPLFDATFDPATARARPLRPERRRRPRAPASAGGCETETTSALGGAFGRQPDESTTVPTAARVANASASAPRKSR
jgi:hypothetical protein